ncbi:hypothetical protein C8R47DRAFT_1205340 [Mycena vitilis]|nr:hypothetical protein C8R47DRAFT_1205340 [Mycena vitilis]
MLSLPTFAFASTADEVGEALAGEIQGKNVLLTGTSQGGIGFETVRVIAKYANLLIITGYNAERLQATEEAIKKEVPSANLRRLTLDLGSLAAVRTAAAEVNAYPEPLHVLINNAAAPIGPFKLTVDGLESQMATDHIGPFLFTKLIVPKLLASGTASYTPRVIYLSSTGHKFGPGINFDTFGKWTAEAYVPFDAYSQAKCASALQAIELSKRSKGKINAYSLCPGLIYTNIHKKEESIEMFQQTGFLGPDKQPTTAVFDVWKTQPQGAATTIVAAFDPRITDQAGAYLSNGNVANDERAPHSTDPANAEKLWNLTEDIIGEKFEF